MRRIAANYIFPGNSKPLKNGIIEFEDDGTIINIVDTKGELRESRNLEFHNGIITPGFINTHCHLELSHLKSSFPKYGGLPEFLKNIVKSRGKFTKDQINEAIQRSLARMEVDGIVACADICNTPDTLEAKVNSKILFYNLIEVMGLEDEIDRFNNAQSLFKQFNNSGQLASIVPHASYSLSNDFFQLIQKFHEGNNLLYSIHNQETSSEADLFIEGKGALKEVLENLNVKINNIPSTGKNSLLSILPFLPQKNLLLVHNLYSKEEDIQFISTKLNPWWVICPQSNLYIEDKLPPVEIISKYSDQITIGTDSLASNESLSQLEEMKCIQQNFPEVSIQDIVKWSSLNGAKALGIANLYGSIEIGKKPGLNLITSIDFSKMKLTDKSKIKVLSFPN